MQFCRFFVVSAIIVALIAIGWNIMTEKPTKTSDWTVLQSIWFRSVKGETHSERLESFYAPQASSYDRYRSRLLWAREPLLQKLAEIFKTKRDIIWVDLGGGTGSNVETMESYLSLDHFQAIYVVDLCHSLCEQAKIRVQEKGWENVHIVEADACKFVPPQNHSKADLITFSYALSMIPNFIAAVDIAKTYLTDEGQIGVCDFYVSAKYDVPERQMSWFRRFWWQMIFDLDGVYLGSERRLYLENRFETVWEQNGQGSIPYVPFYRAPWYVWIGKKAKEMP